MAAAAREKGTKKQNRKKQIQLKSQAESSITSVGQVHVVLAGETKLQYT